MHPPLGTFLTDHSAIDLWMRHLDIKRYNIDMLTHRVDVDGDVNIGKYNFTQLPINFKTVTGHFNCERNQLKTLAGIPQSIFKSLSYGNNPRDCIVLPYLFNCKQHIGDGIKLSRDFYGYSAMVIINKWLESKDILSCVDELLDAGFEQFCKGV